MQHAKTQFGLFSHLTKAYFKQALQQRKLRYDLDQFIAGSGSSALSASITGSGLLKSSNNLATSGNTLSASSQTPLLQEMHSAAGSRCWLHGGTAIITGATTGIGRSTLEQMMQLPLDTIVFTSRDLNKGERVRKQIVEQAGPNAPNLQVWELDLSDFDSVRAFAQRWQSSGMPLDLLVNNAGQLDLSPRTRITNNGFEAHLQVNHLSPFLLTKLLLPAMRSGSSNLDPARVVCVNSSLHHAAHVTPNTLNGPHHSILAYANSKLLQLMCVSELNKVMGKWHSTEKRSVRGVAISPGFVKSEIGVNGSTPLWTQALLMPAKKFFARDSASGAACVFDAVFRDVDDGIHSYYDQMEPASVNNLVKNRALRTLVWNFSTMIARRAEVGNYTPKQAQEHLQWFEQEFSSLAQGKKQRVMSMFDFEAPSQMQLVRAERTWLEGMPWMK